MERLINPIMQTPILYLSIIVASLAVITLSLALILYLEKKEAHKH